jgi:6-phosphogluconate dehydrogenase
MQLGMIGLGRMGANMVRRLLKAGHQCVVYDVNPQNVATLVAEGCTGAASYGEFLDKLAPPRAVWLMLPAAITGKIAREIANLMASGDILIDGGNSFYRDAVDLGAELAPKGISFVDVGTSGGVWGLERGYSQMIGGPKDAVQRLDPILAALAPGTDGHGGTPGNAHTGTEGYLHCGPTGAGHFVKMVHNGIEYGIMAAYAEGMNILKAADAGNKARDADAETAPLRDPQYYRFDLDLVAISEVWRHGSVIGSWLLDLTATALKEDPQLSQFSGRVSDSGEGRWTLQAAIETGVPAPVLSSALFERFASRDSDEFANKMLSAMRYSFGGHTEKLERKPS